jgi:hypothetical protein
MTRTIRNGLPKQEIEIKAKTVFVCAILQQVQGRLIPGLTSRLHYDDQF